MDSTGLVLTVRFAFGNESDIVVGFPGLPNEKRRVYTGDALLYETPMGTFDIRVLSQSRDKVRFLVTQLSPVPSIAGAFSSADPGNAPFSPLELEKIALSLEAVMEEMSSQPAIQPEQIALIHKKLDEIGEAATRLGRKDWINYAAGAITSACASAAFAPDVTKSIFLSLNSAFSWLFSSVVLLLK
ncbi:hypothetical protein CX648_14080 [Aeromonas dhakensis]|nr:hypothetical protein CX648_14080 [Aeromonas dhakensis]